MRTRQVLGVAILGLVACVFVTADEAKRDTGGREVVVTGVGTTEEEAKQNAFQNAVEQAVGVYVDAATLVKNEKLVHEKVLTYSNAYIKSYEVLRTIKDKGTITLRIKAVVQTEKLTEKLQSEGIKTVRVDGPGIAAEIVTKEKTAKDGAALLQSALGDYPLPFVQFNPSANLSPGKEGGLDTTVKYSVDRTAYPKYIAGVEKVLKLMAERSGTGVFGLEESNTKLYWKPGLSDADEKTLREVLKDTNQKECRFLIVAKTVTPKTARDRDLDSAASHRVIASWYLLKDGPAGVFPEAWGRSRSLKLNCRLKDAEGAEVALDLVKPYPWPRGKDKSILLPGGPAGAYWSDNSLDVLTSREQLESSQQTLSHRRVMLILPGFFVEHPEGGQHKFLDRMDVPVHFDVARDKVKSVKTFTVTPELPGVDKTE